MGLSKFDRLAEQMRGIARHKIDKLVRVKNEAAKIAEKNLLKVFAKEIKAMKEAGLEVGIGYSGHERVAMTSPDYRHLSKRIGKIETVVREAINKMELSYCFQKDSYLAEDFQKALDKIASI